MSARPAGASRPGAGDDAQAAVFEAMADDTRRRVLEMLHDAGSATAGQVAAAFTSISRPAVSRHLRVLREAGLVEAEPEGREVHYRLCTQPLAHVLLTWLPLLTHLSESALERLKKQVERAND